MSRCSRIEKKYTLCRHELYLYKFCGGNHQDTHEKRAECYNTKALPAPTTQKVPAEPMNCHNCKAKMASWDCCGCQNTMEAGTIECSGCQHDVCPDCSTGEN